ncbi:winged helix-turn-helix domain-containing protein [Methanococcoides alaskense]|uniref:Transcriptional regulator n=1 Tax=Methanococcoides alaskense TaxID=325778 RepID=A0AA90Z9N8_9EURY|nr:winged helix-turn-helix domain-containing protein [Methanococcoides alaskense]MDA0524510.1 winged helix-turn-helix domain-containing protein [Methanococcoides alaskense]MDR6223985.1 putative transcriptional regulator [Methanococcoides alaskense]
MRRGKIEIMVDILNVVKKSQVTKTAIVYNANLNFNRADQYINMMMDVGLVEKTLNKYSITDLGSEYLYKINDMDSIFSAEF